MYIHLPAVQSFRTTRSLVVKFDCSDWFPIQNKILSAPSSDSPYKKNHLFSQSTTIRYILNQPYAFKGTYHRLIIYHSLPEILHVIPQKNSNFKLTNTVVIRGRPLLIQSTNTDEFELIYIHYITQWYSSRLQSPEVVFHPRPLALK